MKFLALLVVISSLFMPKELNVTLLNIAVVCLCFHSHE